MLKSKFLWVMIGLLAVAVVILWISAGPTAAYWSLALIAVVGAYLWLCTLVGSAAGKKGRSEGTWFLLAFLFGIVFPALIVALMRPESFKEDYLDDPDDYKDCPFCGEEVLVVAKKCKHCGEFFNQ